MVDFRCFVRQLRYLLYLAEHWVLGLALKQTYDSRHEVI